MLFTTLAQTANTTTTTDAPGHGFIVNLFIWLFVGLVAGFIASKIVNKTGEGLILDIVLGLVGSLVGGFLFNLLGIGGAGNLPYSIVVATVGAILVLVIYHKVTGRKAAA